MKLPKGRLGLIIVLIIAFSYIAFCIWGIMNDSPNPLNIVYSQPTKTSLPIDLSYPPPTGGRLEDKALQVSFDLYANNKFAEGINLTLKNIFGVVYAKNALGNNIQWITIGFSNTYPCTPFTTVYGWLNETEIYNYEGLDGATLDVSDEWDSEDFLILKRVREAEEFNFPVAGDYSPSIIIALENKTMLFHTYDSIKVHVASDTELQSQRLDRINGLVSLALFALAFVETFHLILVLTGRKKDQPKIQKKRKMSKRRFVHLKTLASKRKRHSSRKRE